MVKISYANLHLYSVAKRLNQNDTPIFCECMYTFNAHAFQTHAVIISIVVTLLSLSLSLFYFPFLFSSPPLMYHCFSTSHCSSPSLYLWDSMWDTVFSTLKNLTFGRWKSCSVVIHVACSNCNLWWDKRVEFSCTSLSLLKRKKFININIIMLRYRYLIFYERVIILS